MKRFISFLVFLSLFAVLLSAESVWEGSAAAARFGEFPDRGNYGASASFRKNTLVEVRNLETGRRATVIIVDRLDDTGLFMLLSQDAATELGIQRGEIVQVRVLLAHQGNLVRAFADDRPYNPDPDINPAAAAASRDTLDRIAAAERRIPEPEPEPAPEPAPEPIDSARIVDTREPEPDEPERVVDDREADVPTPPTEVPYETVDPEREAKEEVPALADIDPGEPEPEPTPEPEPAPEAEPEPEPAPEPDQDVPVRVTDIIPPPAPDAPDELLVLSAVDEPDVPPLIVEERVADAVTDRVSVSELETPERPAEPDDVPPTPSPPEPHVRETFLADEVETPPADTLVVSELESPKREPDEDDLEHEDVTVEPALVLREPEAPVISVLDDPERPEAPAADEAVAVDEPPVRDRVSEIRLTLLDSPEVEDPPDEETPEVAAADLPEPATVVPETPKVVDGPTPTPPEYGEVDLALEPAEPRPPAPVSTGTGLRAAKAEPEPDPEELRIADAEPEVREPEPIEPLPPVRTVLRAPATDVPVATSLSVDAYYVQVGVFAEARSVRELTESLGATYPLTVYRPGDDTAAPYRVLVGPLNQDESGALLVSFRSRGYRDAFIRRGN